MGQAPTQIVCGVNHPSLVDVGQGVVHACVMVRPTSHRDGVSSSTGRSHGRTWVCNTAYIIVSQHTQPVVRYLVGPTSVALPLVGEACTLRGSYGWVRLEIVAGASQIVDERVRQVQSEAFSDDDP
jgi:hypothetical protein